MIIPSSFRNAIKKAFYDKDITIRSLTVSLDDSHYEIKTVGDIKATIKGSVRFTKLELIKEEFGIEESIDMLVSIDPDNQVELLDIVQYADQDYEVVAVLPYDSSIVIGCRKWQP